MSRVEDTCWFGEKIKNTDYIWFENQSMLNKTTQTEQLMCLDSLGAFLF